MANPPRDTEARFARLVDTTRRLRRDCPWDREQTNRSIMPCLVEETYELLEALENEDVEEVRAELGDVLLQVLFHAEIASERGEFDVWDVIETVRDKLVRRHPHVFGDLAVKDSDEALRNWARIKSEERRDQKRDASSLAGVPTSLPALLRAQRLGEKASHVGFDWPDAAAVLDKIREELAEIEDALAARDATRIEEEVGDCLFALASLGRKSGISAEMALRRSLDRFRDRFDYVESELARRGRDPRSASLEEMEELWQEAKRAKA